MEINDAIKIMASGRKNELRGDATGVIANALTSSWSDSELCDWISQGDYKSTDTLEMIQADLNDAQND